MMSRTLISSASRTGSQIVIGTAANRIDSCLVRDGNSGREDVWHWQVPVLGGVMFGQHRHHRAARLQPTRTCRWPQAYRSVAGAPAPGARMSNRRVNIQTRHPNSGGHAERLNLKFVLLLIVGLLF